MITLNDTDLVVLGDLNYQEALREQTRATGGEVVEDADLLLLAGPGGHPMLNFAVRLRGNADAKRCIERARDFFAPRRAGFSLTLMNAYAEDDLRQAAESSGMISLMAPPAMFCDRRLAASTRETDLRVVRDESGLADYRAVSERAWATYGIPPEVPRRIFESISMVRAPHMCAVVAYTDDEPMSCAMVLLTHGMGGVYWVGTDPGGRGSGLGEACTRFVTNAAFDAGARFVALQASPMGEPIYLRMGYRTIGEYGLVVAPEPDDGS
jgi:ribosomal protein S18 acetylase RimI-like enzyme